MGRGKHRRLTIAVYATSPASTLHLESGDMALPRALGMPYRRQGKGGQDSQETLALLGVPSASIEGRFPPHRWDRRTSRCTVTLLDRLYRCSSVQCGSESAAFRIGSSTSALVLWLLVPQAVANVC